MALAAGIFCLILLTAAQMEQKKKDIQRESFQWFRVELRAAERFVCSRHEPTMVKELACRERGIFFFNFESLLLYKSFVHVRVMALMHNGREIKILSYLKANYLVFRKLFFNVRQSYQLFVPSINNIMKHSLVIPQKHTQGQPTRTRA